MFRIFLLISFKYHRPPCDQNSKMYVLVMRRAARKPAIGISDQVRSNRPSHPQELSTRGITWSYEELNSLVF